MKIIFSNYIKDYDIRLTELEIWYDSYHLPRIVGEFKISQQVYTELREKCFTSRRNGFSLCNDKLRTYFYDCIILRITHERNSDINIRFSVFEIGKTSLPMPDSELENIPSYIRHYGEF